MKYISVKGHKEGKEIDIKVSTLLMGAGDFLRIENMDFAAPILDKFVELGGNTFDTARHYRHSEKAIGQWMKERNNRDKITIFTKGCHPVREYPDTPRVNAKSINEDIETSLEMLGTDHLEMFALHRDDRSIPVSEIMTELDRQVRMGRVYAVGVSNWELDRLIEANNYAKDNGLTELSFNSPNLSLAKCLIPRWPGCVSANDDMVKWHEENHLPLIAWSSQSGGFFSGRFSPENTEDKEMVEVFYCKENWERYDRAKKIAKEKNVSTIQIALAYVLNQKFQTAAAVGPEKMEELESSYLGSNVTLTQNEMDYLNLK